MAEDSIKIHRGLVGVYFDRTKTTFINGKEGILEGRAIVFEGSEDYHNRVNDKDLKTPTFSQQNLPSCADQFIFFNMRVKCFR